MISFLNTDMVEIHIPELAGDFGGSTKQKKKALAKLAGNGDICYAVVSGEFALTYVCKILKRSLPPTETYIFCGSNARTIALNFF